MKAFPMQCAEGKGIKNSKILIGQGWINKRELLHSNRKSIGQGAGVGT